MTCPAAGIPAGLEFATKAQLAMRQLERLADAAAALDLQGRHDGARRPAGRGGQGVPADHRRRLTAVFRTVAEAAARD